MADHDIMVLGAHGMRALSYQHSNQLRCPGEQQCSVIKTRCTAIIACNALGADDALACTVNSETNLVLSEGSSVALASTAA